MRLKNSILAVVLTASLAGCKDTTSPGTIPTDTTTKSTKPWANGPLTISSTGQGMVPERYSAEVAADGQWAYTTTWGQRTTVVNGTTIRVLGNAVKIWNVSGAVPVLVDSLIIQGAVTTSDVQLSDDKKLLVVSTETNPGSIVIFDRSTTPGKPVQIGRFAVANTSPGVHTVKLGTVNGRNYAFLQIDPPARLVVADITDPRNITEVASITMGNPYVHDVFFRDGFLFAGLWDDGMRIFDVGAGTNAGTPAKPVAIGTVVTAPGIDAARAPASEAHNVYWFQDPTTGSKQYAFVGQEGFGSIGASASGDVHVIDVSDKAHPKEVAFYGVSGAGTHNFAVDETNGIMYAAYYNGGVRALDIRGDLGTCTDAQKETLPAGSTRTARCDLRLMKREAGVWQPTTPVYIWGVVLVGTKLYASDMINGIWKLDVSNIHP